MKNLLKKKKSSNQLFSNFFSKTITFTKFLLKNSDIRVNFRNFPTVFSTHSVNLHWSIAHLISRIYSCNYKRPKQRSIFQKNVKATIIVPKLSIDCRFGLSLNDFVQDIFFLDSVFRREVNVDLAFQSHILENAYHFVVSMMA